ncbi:MAG: cytochrome c peroxidase [Chloroflexota bacterium]
MISLSRFIILIPIVGVFALGMYFFNMNTAVTQDVPPEYREEFPTLPDSHYNYANVDLPRYFENGDLEDADNTPNNNPVTDAGATLGRVLFYDVRLSANDTTSCASCHVQANGFSDPNPFSTGFEGGLTGRNSMGLANARFYERGAFFWDERAETLEDQVLMPIQDPVEMGMDLASLETKLATTDFYPDLFEDAFGTPEITSERISLALAQFVRSMISYESKFDEGVQSDFENFTGLEELGRTIFNGSGRCSQCHETRAQILDEPRNIGLDLTTIDAGVGGVTGNGQEDGAFKVGSLRNIALTAPYMHDGRFQTLEEVIEFYNDGVQDHDNLDSIMQNNNGNVRRLNLSDQEITALVAYLNTFTDESFVTDEKFSNPFQIDLSFFPEKAYLPLIVGE